MRIFAVIVTYNAIEWLDKCLLSLRLSSVPLIPVVIDNLSKDNTCSYIEEHFSEVVLFRQKRNLGFGQANNIGLEYAIKNEADYVLLLNQDAWIEKEAIANLLKFNDGNSLLSPIHLNGQGSDLDENFKNNAVLKSTSKNKLLADLLLNKPLTKYATYEINAACWLLPIKIIREIGGFNPLFFHYAEDVNYLHRLHYHGKGVFFVPSAVVYHDREQRPPKIIDKNCVYRDMLLIINNVNYRLGKCAFLQMRYFLGLTHTMLNSRRFILWWFYIKAALKIYIIDMPKIKNSRYKEKHICTNWIDI